MMRPPLGDTFAPTHENAAERGGRQAEQAQRALQTVSYQMPKFAGAGRRLSPLQGSTFAGSPVSQAVLQSVLQTLGLGSMAGGGEIASGGGGGFAGGGGRPDLPEVTAAMFTGGSAPSRAPVIHPGDTGGRIPLTEPEMVPTFDAPVFDRTNESTDREQGGLFYPWLGVGRQEPRIPDWNVPPTHGIDIQGY